MKNSIVNGRYNAVSRWFRTSVHCLLPTAYFLLPAVYFLIVYPATGQRNKNPKPYYENLTVHRLTFSEIIDSGIVKVGEPKIFELLPPKNSVSPKVEEVLDSIARFNKTKMFVDGFTIQLYAGMKREDAMNAKKKMAEEAKDLVADLRYEQPKWSVKTGSYYSRLEAQRDLHRLKKVFPNAILIPEKVALKRP